VSNLGRIMSEKEKLTAIDETIKKIMKRWDGHGMTPKVLTQMMREINSFVGACRQQDKLPIMSGMELHFNGVIPWLKYQLFGYELIVNGREATVQAKWVVAEKGVIN